jgi:hypothetical protein
MALLWSAPGWATDLRLALGAQGEYDSNVYRRETKIRDDFVILGIPSLQLLETEGKFTYEAGYEFPYQHSIKTNALNNFNHLARVGADYHMNDRTQFSFSNRFSYVEALADNDNNDTPTIADNNTDQEVMRNRATFRSDHRFTPRLANNTTFTQELYYNTQDNRQDNQSYGLSTGLHYDLTERQTLGGGIQSSYQNFQDAYNLVGIPLVSPTCNAFGFASNSVQREEIPESQAVFVGPYAAWSYRIDEQSQLHVSGGPTYVYNTQDAFIEVVNNTCTRQGSDSDSRIAFFGEFSLDRRWSPTMISGFSSRRHQDAASGVSGSAMDPGDARGLDAAQVRDQHRDRRRRPRHPALGGGGQPRLPHHEEPERVGAVSIQQAAVPERYRGPLLGLRRTRGVAGLQLRPGSDRGVVVG